MAVPMESMGTAFERLPARPAVFDREIRERLGLWRLSETVPLDVIVEHFIGHSTFERSGSRVVLPLHEPDSAELTGAYISYLPDAGHIEYYNFASQGFERVPLDAGKRLYPAWLLRFWHEGFEPEAPPSFAPQDQTDHSPPTTGADVTESEPVEAAFFQELRMFVERQREGARRTARDRFTRLSSEQYHNSVGGIPRATAQGRTVDDYGQQAIVLRIPEQVQSDFEGDGSAPNVIADAYGIGPGMEVIVDPVEPIAGFPVEAEVIGIDGPNLELGVYWDRSDDKGSAETEFGSDNGTVFRVGKLLDPTTFDRETDAIETIEADDRKRDILLGKAAPSFDEGQGIPVNEAALDAYQTHAAKTALRADDIFCIHGPPGTGKTRTLTEIIEAATGEGWRVLACAHSNQAIDNLLAGNSTDDRTDPDSLHAAATDGRLSLARAGSNCEHPLVQEEYTGNDIWQADVVGATTSAAARFDRDEFDLVVLDEATQASIPASLLPYSKGRRLILAGDHKQLPPYHSTEGSDQEEIEPSLFEHLLERHGDGISAMLRCQYRMHKRIAAFPNVTFYDGKLTHGQPEGTRPPGTLLPIEGVDVKGDEKRTPAQSYCNELEAKAVARQVSTLLFQGVKPDRIGVITPYSGQIGKIRGRLRDLSEVDQDVDTVKVATVDSFQGSECDVVIVSFVRSNPEGYSGFLTFPNEGPRRLNVAMTRAKRRLVLIANWETLVTRAPNKGADESAAEIYQKLYTHLMDRDLMTEFPAGDR